MVLFVGVEHPVAVQAGRALHGQHGRCWGEGQAGVQAHGALQRAVATRSEYERMKAVIHIGVLGVDKDGEEWYQITLGGEQGNDAAIGKVIGPSFYADEIPDVMTNIINTYVAERSEHESFIDTYRRLGVAPFKDAAYKNAKKKEKAAKVAEGGAA